jgi:hypothetical protein
MAADPSSNQAYMEKRCLYLRVLPSNLPWMHVPQSPVPWGCSSDKPTALACQCAVEEHNLFMACLFRPETSRIEGDYRRDRINVLFIYPSAFEFLEELADR